MEVEQLLAQLVGSRRVRGEPEAPGPALLDGLMYVGHHVGHVVHHQPVLGQAGSIGRLDQFHLHLPEAQEGVAAALGHLDAHRQVAATGPGRPEPLVVPGDGGLQVRAVVTDVLNLVKHGSVLTANVGMDSGPLCHISRGRGARVQRGAGSKAYLVRRGRPGCLPWSDGNTPEPEPCQP